MRLCIHSDINNDDKSTEVEQHVTKLIEFVIFSAATPCMDVMYAACVCVRGQDALRIQGERF